MTRLIDIDFYNIKEIKNFFTMDKYFPLHCCTVVYQNNLEQFVCLNEDEFKIFWAHYKKII